VEVAELVLLVARSAAYVAGFEDDGPRQLALQAYRELVHVRHREVRVRETNVVAAQERERAERRSGRLQHGGERVAQRVGRCPVAVIRRHERRLNAEAILPALARGV